MRWVCTFVRVSLQSHTQLQRRQGTNLCRIIMLCCYMRDGDQLNSRSYGVIRSVKLAVFSETPTSRNSVKSEIFHDFNAFGYFREDLRRLPIVSVQNYCSLRATLQRV